MSRTFVGLVLLASGCAPPPEPSEPITPAPTVQPATTVAELLDQPIDMGTRDYRFLGYIRSVRARIEKVWNYPRGSVERHEQGSVRARFTVKRDGSVVDPKVVESSGFSDLDVALVAAIIKAAPYPPFPSSIDRDSVVLKGDFKYVLSWK